MILSGTYEEAIGRISEREQPEQVGGKPRADPRTNQRLGIWTTDENSRDQNKRAWAFDRIWVGVGEALRPALDTSKII